MYTISFTNNSTVITDPWVTFVQATQVVSGTTQLVGPALTATGGNNVGALANGTSYNLAAIGNTVSMGPTDWQGHMYISDGALTLPTSGGLPVDAAYTLTTDGARYQYLEFAGSATSANVDITYINWYSIPLQMGSTTQQSSPTRGAPLSQSALSGMMQTLAGLTGSNAVTTVQNASGDVVRVISPNAGNPSWLPLYASFQDYLTSAFGATAATIPVNNSYSGIGSPPSPDFQPQTYKLTASTYDGTTLTLQGNSDLVGDFTMTSTMTSTEFSSVIYLAVMNYAWSYKGMGKIAAASNANGNTGDNNVFSAVSRDLMAGFAYGFVGSTKYGAQPSSAWMAAPTTDVFSAIQASNAYYNPWANAIAAAFSDVYTFPFNDFLSNSVPEIAVNDGDTLTVTLLSTAASASDARAARR